MADVKRGICSVCGRAIRVKIDGMIGRHGARDGAWSTRVCDGYGRPRADWSGHCSRCGHSVYRPADGDWPEKCPGCGRNIAATREELFRC